MGIGLLLFQVQLATVSGSVTKPGSNEPLPGATVILTPAAVESLNRGSAQTSRIRSTVSEDDGRFMIPDVEPGDYRLQVQSPLYGGAAYGQRRSDGPGVVLTIKAGQRLSDLKISMMPTGTIAGRVTGRGGDPLAYATVQALKYGYQDGKRTLATVQNTTTDDRGEYRLFWLPSGKYVVVAGALSGQLNLASTTPPLRPGGTILTSDLPFTGLPGLTQRPGAQLEATNLVKRILDDGTVREESWMPTYYPATTDRAQAVPVDVAAGSNVGATVTGINITLGPSLIQKIRGRVTGGTQVTVTLAPAGQGTAARLINTSASTIDGSFEFPGVVPGPYYVTALDRAGLVAPPMPVLVADRDVENLAIAVGPTITISARITAGGLTPGELESYGLVGILRPERDTTARATLRQPNVLMGPGNTMTWESVPSGDYQLNIQQNAALRDNLKRLYIKSIRFGREDAFDTVHVSSNTMDVLEVVLTAETGSVEGAAIGRAGDPAANVTVVLVPTNARKRTALYKTLVTGSDGKFRFQEIPPGDYKLFAWEDIEIGAWEDPEFIRPYESRGRAVRIPENGKEEIQLNVIQNP